MKRITRMLLCILTVGVLCLLVFGSLTRSEGQRRAAGEQRPGPPFDFQRFTKGQAFRLNTLPTTIYGPPWADVIVQGSNMIECQGAPIALCYYSGPGPTTPCTLDGLGIANCTCYEIPRGQPYLVDINAILNLDIYLKTVAKCGKQGDGCKRNEAPVCEAINNNTLIPGADLISTFSLYLDKKDPDQFGIKPTNCGDKRDISYAGCMTAPCKRTGKKDRKTGLDLVQCGCPTYTGPYQVGTRIDKDQCTLEGNYIWSAAYNPNFKP